MPNAGMFRCTWIKGLLACGGLTAMVLGLATGCGGRDSGPVTPVSKSHSLAAVAALRSQAPHTYELTGLDAKGARVTGTITLGREQNQEVNGNKYDVSGFVLQLSGAGGLRIDRRLLIPVGNPLQAFHREAPQELVPVHGHHPLPASANSNDNGTLGTILGPDGATERSWALAAGEEPGTATVTLSYQFKGKDEVVVPRATVEERYQINRDGSIRAAEVVADLNPESDFAGKTTLQFDPAKPKL